MSPERFDAAVNELDDAIGTLAPHQIIVRMAQIGALLGDAHTYVDLPAEGPLAFSRLPVRLTLLSDGIFVTATTADLQHLLGHRLERLGQMSVDGAFQRVATAVSRDNESTLRFLVPRRMVMPEVLHAVGVIGELKRVPLVLADRSGTSVELQLAPLESDDEPDWREGAGVFGSDTALYWADPEANYWLRHLPDRRALYLQFNAVRDRDDEPLADFALRLGDFITANQLQRLVIDLRRNIGGNSRLTYPLIREIIKTGVFQQPGRLFTLIGPASISATVVFAIELDRYTENIFIGEPSGGRPNQYGENRFFALPNSGVAVSYASAFFQTAGPFNERPWIEPLVAVSMSSEDYFAGRDPALEAALSYEAPQPLAEIVGRAVRSEGIDSALQAYRRYKADARNRYLDTERGVRRLADELLEEGRVDDALALYEANLASYPKRARAHLGLALAYQSLGRTALARQEFESGLSLLDTDQTLYNAQRYFLEEFVRERLAELP